MRLLAVRGLSKNHRAIWFVVSCCQRNTSPTIARSRSVIRQLGRWRRFDRLCIAIPPFSVGGYTPGDFGSWIQFGFWTEKGRGARTYLFRARNPQSFAYCVAAGGHDLSVCFARPGGGVPIRRIHSRVGGGRRSRNLGTR